MNTQNNSNNQRNSPPSYWISEEKFVWLLKNLMYMMVILALTRILTLEIMALISDALSALMIFFYKMRRGKCMSIFLVFNGVLGLFSAISRFSFITAVISTKGINVSSSILLIISFYSLVVYGLESILSLMGCFRYDWEFGGLTNSDNYQSVPRNENYGQNNQNSNQQNRGFTAFSGAGTRVG